MVAETPVKTAEIKVQEKEKTDGEKAAAVESTPNAK